jgi:excisionase family DNA binding protein
MTVFSCTVEVIVHTVSRCQVMTTELLTSDELSAELKIPKGTLNNWASQGLGPAFVKVGRHRRYRREDVEAWLTANRTETGQRIA